MKRLSIHLVMVFSIAALLFGAPAGKVQSAAPLQPSTPSPWAGLGFGLNGKVDTIMVSGSDVYVGGAFTQACGNAACSAGNLTVNHIARWNGSAWSALGYGVNSEVSTIAINGSVIDIGGYFTGICANAPCTSGSTPANYVAAWSPSAWSALGSGVNGPVLSMVIYNSQPVIGGSFSRACTTMACTSGSALYNLATWNSSAWIQNGLGVDNAVASLVTDGANLYAAGMFSQGCGNATCSSGNTSLRYLGQWNGHAWSALGYGLYGTVVASLAVSGGRVYAGGYFSGRCVNDTCSTWEEMMGLAQWRGSSWSSPVGGSLDQSVGAVVASGDTVYFGGAFTQFCVPKDCQNNYTQVNHLAQGTDGIGRSLSFGVNSTVSALALSKNQLYLGGDFTAACGEITCAAGSLPLAHIARFTLPAMGYLPLIRK